MAEGRRAIVAGGVGRKSEGALRDWKKFLESSRGEASRTSQRSPQNTALEASGGEGSRIAAGEQPATRCRTSEEG